ncbi:MAG: hypothetical protein U9Q15_02835 [Patescibacteria group bacterium]|nr:hypothetical protein [Patescibacteria group bacterium]
MHAPQARISLADTSVSGVGDGAFALLAGIQSTDNRGIVSYEWKISTASGSVRISDDNIVEMGEFSRDIVYPASIDAGDKDDPFVSFPFDINNNYRVELTVTDAAGNSDTTHRDIYAYQHLPEFSIGRQ